ncbi:MAG: hypothetical protein V8Q28_04015 [Alistipes sp.]
MNRFVRAVVAAYCVLLWACTPTTPVQDVRPSRTVTRNVLWIAASVPSTRTELAP